MNDCLEIKFVRQDCRRGAPVRMVCEDDGDKTPFLHPYCHAPPTLRGNRQPGGKTVRMAE